MYSVSQIFILSVGRESNKKPGKFWGNIEKHSQGTCLFWTPESSGFQDDNRELPTVDDEQPAAGTIYTYKETEVIFFIVPFLALWIHGMMNITEFSSISQCSGKTKGGPQRQWDLFSWKTERRKTEICSWGI